MSRLIKNNVDSIFLNEDYSHTKQEPNTMYSSVTNEEFYRKQIKNFPNKKQNNKKINNKTSRNFFESNLSEENFQEKLNQNFLSSTEDYNPSNYSSKLNLYETSENYEEENILKNNQISQNTNFQDSYEYSENKTSVQSQSEKKTGKWSEPEDQILSSLVSKFGVKNWKRISEYISGRTPIQCLHRWTKILQPGLVKGPWTIEEDRRLIDWVKREGPTKWTQCSDFIKGRNGKQCRERWFHTLNPKVVKGNWTEEEDFKIFSFYKSLGGKWSKIALFIQGRTENSIKNRFYSTLRRKAAEKNKFVNNHTVINTDKQEYFNDSVEFSEKNNFFSDEIELEEKNINSNLITSSLKNSEKNKNNLSLENLLEFFPYANNEIAVKFMKVKNFTREQMKDYENQFLENLKPKEKKNKNNHEFMNQNSNINNPHQTCNINVNFNFNNNTNTKTLKQNNDVNINNGKNINFPSEIKENKNNIFNEKIYENNPINNLVNFTNKDINEYKNFDIFDLENNIIDMCDNPSFMYPDTSYNFLDAHVDNIIEDIFLKNNLFVTNEDEENCNLCFTTTNKDKNPQNSEDNFMLENNRKINEEKKEEVEFLFENEEIKENEISLKPIDEKNNKLNSLISQLEDLEKLLKKTKTELIEYNTNDGKGKQYENLNEKNLKFLNSKIENLFK